MEDLKDLVSRRGEDLAWGDFAVYSSTDVGSGLYMYRYPIDEKFCLLVSGGSLQAPPMAIRLVSEANRDNYIDVRYEDIDEFLSTAESSDD